MQFKKSSTKEREKKMPYIALRLTLYWTNRWNINTFTTVRQSRHN